MRSILRTLPARNFSTSSIKHNIKDEKWDIISAVGLERKPVITRDLTELESRFNQLLLQIEYERSHKSNIEVRQMNDRKRAQDVKEGKISITDMESFPQQTGQDFIDASLEELKSFNFAPRKNSTSKSDTKSVNRDWDRYLLLLVNEKIGENYQWVLPQGKHKDGETLRQTAERVLLEKCGGNIKCQFMGNAPCGFYKYKYPKLARKETVGAKIFFYKAEFFSGQIELEKCNCKDYEWATRQELEKIPNEYLKSVKMFLIDEEH
ncbi:large ribosomal subunit protein mL46 [Halyomorpha halys]|uniref:large ribosomal subunit protein mL46 n=1 Tax=Halyomorpha halys TaxID=286706 RepID=UPI0006D50B63|nr:39S ribosomal protein L46, mitochondrial [Halyomorpha halys]